MKIRTKMSLLSGVFLIAMTLVITGVIAYGIISNTKSEIKEYRLNELTRVKQELKDKVDMVHTLVSSEYESMTSILTIEKHFGRRVRNVIESAYSMLEGYQQRVAAGEMSLEEAQKRAKDKIAQIRYDSGVGYIWINDTQEPYPKMIMHPTVPSLNGKMLDNKKWETAKGSTSNLFSAAVKLTKKDKEGFVEYEWSKPKKDGSLSKMQPKISYVSLFKDWGWVIGSGIYIDDVQKYSVDKVKDTILNLRYDSNNGYFFITTNDTPYPTMLLNPVAPQLEEKILNNAKWNNLANNKTEHVFRALVDEAKSPNNEGFVDYVWNKPVGNGATKELVPKVSYVREFKPLGWVIGSGVYLDEIEKNIIGKQKEMKDKLQRLMLLITGVAIAFLVLSLASSYFFATSLSKGLEELTRVAREISLGKDLDKEIESTKRNDEIGQLARAVERLQTSVKMMLERMKK